MPKKENGGLWNVKSGKFIPEKMLCKWCGTRRIHKDFLCHTCLVRVASGSAAVRWCCKCKRHPAAIEVYPNTSYCEDCLKAALKIRIQKDIDNDMANGPRPRLGQNVPPPKRWKSNMCWHCKRQKGPMIPIESLYCFQCYMSHCQHPGCTAKPVFEPLQGNNGTYFKWCRAHYNELTICHMCAERKPIDGLFYCKDCRTNRYDAQSRRRIRYNRRTPFACVSCGEMRVTGYKYCQQCLDRMTGGPNVPIA